MKLFDRILIICALTAQAWAASANAGPTLTDFWEGRATWVKDADKIGAGFGFHFISIVPQQEELWAYYISSYKAADGKGKMTIGRARGTDGINWTNDGQVLNVGKAEQGTNVIAAWDDRMTSFPGAWKDGDTWYLVYEGAGENFAQAPGDVGLATSKDGRNFVKHPGNPILRHNPGDWERVNIGTPSLYKENGIWYLFYHSYDGNVCQIGVASGTNLAHLAKAANNPIIPVAPGHGAWDTGTTGRRSRIVKEGVYYYMAFEGSTEQPYPSAKWSSGLARSTNLTSGWVKYPGQQIIPQTTNGMGYDGPELLRLKDTWYLYVRVPGNETVRYRLETSKNNVKVEKP